MYFGSVKFFKHLILLVLGFAFLTLTILVIVFVTLWRVEKTRAVTVTAQYEELAARDELYIPANVTDQELYDALKKHGASTADILKMLQSDDPAALTELYKEQIFGLNGTVPGYVTDYPDLYVSGPAEFVAPASKTVYLTFDDGPSANTPLVLSILEKYNIKATFFMSVPEGNTESSRKWIQQVAQAGHTIGIHSNSHNYSEVYQSVDSYLQDLKNTSDLIESASGKKPDILRFPGGSINNYNRFIYKQLISEITRRGYVYYDWNVSGEDASTSATWTSIYNNVLRGMDGKDSAVVLLHDSSDKRRTVTVLEDLILALQEDGYQFAPLTNEVRPVVFSYLD